MINGLKTSLALQKSILARQLLDNVKARFPNLESNPVFAQPTYLDPRFKKNGFNEADSLRKCRDLITNSLNQLVQKSLDDAEHNPPLLVASKSRSEEGDDGIWSHYKKKVANIKPTSVVSSILEMRQYTEEQLVGLKGDPLEWWRIRQLVFPNLSKVARKHLGIVATSVPSERIFSKAGVLVSERRNRLNPENVEKIIFLNANFEYI